MVRLLVLCSLCSLCSLWFLPAAGAAPPTYWQDVRPVLRKHCTACHSTKNAKEVEVSGGLALDNYEAVRKGTKQPVIRPGRSAASVLIQRLTSTDDDQRMPQGGAALSAETIALIRRWIDDGAVEGRRPESGLPPVAAPSARRPRLDITLPTNAIPPRGWLGQNKTARLELALKVGPLAPVTAVAFSPDGKLLVTGSYRQVAVWDLTSARVVKLLTNLLGTVNDVRFSPDGRLLAVAGGQPSAKGDLRLFQVDDWKLLATLGGHDDVVFSVAFHPDGQRLASASFDKTVRLWNLTSHKAERVLSGHSDFVYAVAFSPDGKWLVSASKDRSVRLVDTGSGRGRLTFSGMDQDVLAVAVSPDGKRVVSSGLESALYWWDPQTGQRVRTQGGHGGAVHELCFSKDGRLLASAGADKTVRLWDGNTGAPLRALPVGSIAYAVALSPDGKQVASGSFDGLVRLWETATGRPLVKLLAVPPEWLAVTSEGYLASSPGLTALGRWRMGGQAVAAAPVWEALSQPAVLARAVRGEKLPAPAFGK